MREHNWVMSMHSSRAGHVKWCSVCDAFYGTVPGECPGTPPAPPVRGRAETTRPIDRRQSLHQPPSGADAVHPIRDINGKRVK